MIEYCLSDGCCKPTIKITDKGHMSTIEKLCYLIEKVGEVIVVVNGFEERILKNETDIVELQNDITDIGLRIDDIEVRVLSNSDQIRFLTDQFEGGATGQVIDGGIAGDSEIDKNFDGGVV